MQSTTLKKDSFMWGIYVGEICIAWSLCPWVVKNILRKEGIFVQVYPISFSENK